ncbi:hypothetical protein McPS_19520 [Marichromatium sp. PS1]|uniref:hypothetical protein n=1 Tax=Marichromatium sp. PS1 TaxID=3138932 RepID=UPI0032E7DC55
MFTTKGITKPDRDGFSQDPFGYSASARHKWIIACTIEGFDFDILKPAGIEDFKNPVLWLTQAHALSEAAVVVLKNEPNLKVMPELMRGACDSQYCAVGLMLVGYSLEVCLKAMIIMRDGIDKYLEEEKTHFHHKTHELAGFVPNLSEKENAILKVLHHFVTWAGRYPDPGSKKISNAEDIFSLSEKHQITAKEVFELASKVMGYAKHVADNS